MDQFKLPQGALRRKRARPKSAVRKDHLISALWSLLDGRLLKSLTGAEKSVLLCIAAWADWGSGEVRLSRSSLSRHTGHDERTCRRAVSDLLSRGLIKVSNAGRNGRGYATIYAIVKQGCASPQIGVGRFVIGGAHTPTNREYTREQTGVVASATPPAEDIA